MWLFKQQPRHSVGGTRRSRGFIQIVWMASSRTVRRKGVSRRARLSWCGGSENIRTTATLLYSKAVMTKKENGSSHQKEEESASQFELKDCGNQQNQHKTCTCPAHSVLQLRQGPPVLVAR